MGKKSVRTKLKYHDIIFFYVYDQGKNNKSFFDSFFICRLNHGLLSSCYKYH